MVSSWASGANLQVRLNISFTIALARTLRDHYSGTPAWAGGQSYSIFAAGSSESQVSCRMQLQRSYKAVSRDAGWEAKRRGLRLLSQTCRGICSGSSYILTAFVPLGDLVELV